LQWHPFLFIEARERNYKLKRYNEKPDLLGNALDNFYLRIKSQKEDPTLNYQKINL